MRISRRLPKRDIAIILGTGAEDLTKLGFEIGEPISATVEYTVCGNPRLGSIAIYDSRVSGVDVCLLSRHSGRSYIPAYKVDQTANILGLVDDEQGVGAKVVLASSLVGGCRTTGWRIGDIIAVEDGIDMHGDDFYVDGNKPYIHAHGLFDRETTGLLLEAAGRIQPDLVTYGGIYYSGPDTTGNRFETPAEMARLLAPSYLRIYLDRLAKRAGLDPKELKQDIGLKDKLEPNLVGMTMVREAGYVRALSTRRTDGYRTRFAGLAIISDFPEDEETEHEKNVQVALAQQPKGVRIFAEAIPEIEAKLRNGF